MKNIAALLLTLLSSGAFAQSASEWFRKGNEAIDKKNYEEAIACFDKSIKADAREPNAWYNRALVKSWMKQYEAAIADFDQVIRLQPDLPEAFNLRGNLRRKITDYDGAMEDFSQAISLDKDLAVAWYNRASLYQLLGQKRSACEDFARASALGNKRAKEKEKECGDTVNTRSFSILYLEKVSVDKSYGFSSGNPVKVGPGPDGGPANEQTYLNLLRDAKGEPVEYQRTGSCCGYASEHGFLGTALLDIYDVTYLNAKGKKETKQVYISMYDYEAPAILQGFGTVKKR